MSVTVGVSDAIIAIRDKLRGKIGQTKVKRYWPSKAPEWVDDVDEEIDIKTTMSVTLEKAFPSREDEVKVLESKADARLQRLSERKKVRDEAIAQHRLIRKAEIVSTQEEERKVQEGLEAEEEDEDMLEERRRRIRENYLQKQKEEVFQPEEEEEDEEEEESEYETNSEEEYGTIDMVKPIFVTKVEWDMIAKCEKLEAEERAFEEGIKRRLEERKVEIK